VTHIPPPHFFFLLHISSQLGERGQLQKMRASGSLSNCTITEGNFHQESLGLVLAAAAFGVCLDVIAASLSPAFSLHFTTQFAL
jgi:hypothetical protein